MPRAASCVEIKIYGAFVLNRRVILHAIDATLARWRGDAGSSPLARPRHRRAPDTLVDFHTGCKRMSWQALDWNTPALDFYKALGANRLDSWVNLRLGPAELSQLLGI